MRKARTRRARSRSTWTCTAAKASSISPWRPTISTARSKRCARTAWCSWIRPRPTTSCWTAACRTMAKTCHACKEPHSARRRPRRRPAAADLHREPDRPDLLRDHPAQGQRRLRRRQLQGPVRIDRTGPDAPRRTENGGISTRSSPVGAAARAVAPTLKPRQAARFFRRMVEPARQPTQRCRRSWNCLRNFATFGAMTNWQ